MAFETLLFDVQDGVAHITLNRPEAGNAINEQMGKELMSVTLACDEDPNVRAVLLSSSGRMFCAGGDLSSFAKAGGKMPGLLKELTVYLHAAISHLVRMRAPVIAVVDGAAAGAGFSLVCAADLVLAGESARFTMAYTRAGLTPDGSSTFFLPRLIGRHRTLELMLTNRTLDAVEALNWGLVNRVVADDKLVQEARGVAHGLAQGATAAFGSVKELVLNAANETLETQMELEARAIAHSARTEDVREGIQAFFEKRKPRFRGC